MFCKIRLAEFDIEKGNEILLREEISRSFVLNFCGLMARQLTGQNVYLRNVDGTGYTRDESRLFMSCVSPAGAGCTMAQTYTTTKYQVGNFGDRIGVVIGTGTTEVSPGNYALVNQIRHGDSTGKVLHFGTLISDLTYIPSRSASVKGGSVTWKAERIFYNNSGGSIFVSEAGLYVHGYTYNVRTDEHCVIRDIVTPTVVFTTGTYLKVTYTFSIVC